MNINNQDDVFPLKWSWIILLLTLPLPILSEYSGLDIWLVNIYYDTATATFPWRHVAWFSAWFHDGLRSALLIVPISLLTLWIMTRISPSTLDNVVPKRWQQPKLLAYLFWATLIGPMIVGLLKAYTTRHCPWSLAMYGGLEPYYDLWSAPLFTLTEAGKCFPGGHASGGYGLLAFVPLMSGVNRWRMLALALFVGSFMGWVRMMQGAHFLSHNLWTAWLCWAGIITCYGIFRPDQQNNDEGGKGCFEVNKHD